MRIGFALPAMALLAIAAAAAFLVSGRLTSQAVQNPTISLDMVTTGTTYDDTTNTMTIGTIDSNSTSSNPATHLHQAHLVVNNVEDLIGWQTRLNYIGDRMRIQGQNVAPFLDNNTLQPVGFSNLPIDSVTLAHRNASGSASIPPGAPGPQTALIGGIYNGAQNAPISPDTPAKLVPDDSSYSAPNGGVLSAITLQVVGNQCAQTLLMDLDDDNPNAPGSTVVVFNATGSTTIALAESQLFDGTHMETCSPGSATPTLTATATPGSVTPTPTVAPPPGPLTISLDMVPDGNTYDDSTNTMTVGSIESCLASATANPATHVHQAHLIIQNVTDLIAWQVRLNYTGDKMRPLNQVISPFTDGARSQGVGFVNLPIDQATANHRGVDEITSIPPAAPGPQTALLAADYTGSQDFAISPDSPAKAIPDDTSYRALNGGVLSLMNLQVVGDQTGQTLNMDLDDNNPNAPGSYVIVFTGVGSNTVNLSENALGDGQHVEGGVCQATPSATASPTPCGPCTQTPTRTPTATASGTATPSATPTVSPILSPTPPLTATATVTPSVTPTCFNFCQTPTATLTSTPTRTPTPTATRTATLTFGATEPCCGTPTGTASATPTPCGPCTPTPTLSPADGAITRLRTPHNVQLRPGQPDPGTVSIATSGDFGYNVYLALLPPGGAANPGGCSSGASLVGISTFGGSFTFKPNIGWSCADPAAVDGLNWQVKAFADVHFDDESSCDTLAEAFDGTCAAAIADDDSNDANNTLTRAFPKVVAQ